tara:strand:+ start:80 stop:208 length:129 start_codon:yes stop_codon:yes gene_type:complete
MPEPYIWWRFLIFHECSIYYQYVKINDYLDIQNYLKPHVFNK